MIRPIVRSGGGEDIWGLNVVSRQTFMIDGLIETMNQIQSVLFAL